MYDKKRRCIISKLFKYIDLIDHTSLNAFDKHQFTYNSESAYKQAQNIYIIMNFCIQNVDKTKLIVRVSRVIQKPSQSKRYISIFFFSSKFLVQYL